MTINFIKILPQKSSEFLFFRSGTDKLGIKVGGKFFTRLREPVYPRWHRPLPKRRCLKKPSRREGGRKHRIPSTLAFPKKLLSPIQKISIMHRWLNRHPPTLEHGTTFLIIMIRLILLMDNLSVNDSGPNLMGVTFLTGRKEIGHKLWKFSKFWIFRTHCIGETSSSVF